MMSGNTPSRAGNPALVSTAAFIIIVAGLRAAQVIVVPFLLAAFLTLLTLPTLHWFKRKGLPTWLAMLVISVVVLLVGFLLVGVVGSSVLELQQQLPAYQERVTSLQTSFDDWINEHSLGLDLDFDRQFLDTERVLSLFRSMLGAFGSVLNNALIIVFMLIFMQLEAADLPGKLRAMKMESGDVSLRLERIQSTVWRYVRLKTRISVLTGVLVAAWLWLLGVDFPLLWGLLAFLLNFVPTVGSIIAAVPAVLVAALQPEIAGQPATVGASLYLAGYAAIGYLAINTVIGNVIEPRLLGSGIGLSTLVVFLSLVFWGWVLGPVGMVLSVPLTMIVKIALDNSQEFQWVAILLGSEVPPEPNSVPPSKS